MVFFLVLNHAVSAYFIFGLGEERNSGFSRWWDLFMYHVILPMVPMVVIGLTYAFNRSQRLAVWGTVLTAGPLAVFYLYAILTLHSEPQVIDWMVLLVVLQML